MGGWVGGCRCVRIVVHLMVRLYDVGGWMGGWMWTFFFFTDCDYYLLDGVLICRMRLCVFVCVCVCVILHAHTGLCSLNIAHTHTIHANAPTTRTHRAGDAPGRSSRRLQYHTTNASIPTARKPASGSKYILQSRGRAGYTWDCRRRRRGWGKW